MRFYDLRSLCKTLVDNNQCLKKKKSRTVKEEGKKNKTSKKKKPSRNARGIIFTADSRCAYREMPVASDAGSRQLV